MAKEQFVIYQNGDRTELGEIKRPANETSLFVNYHTGDTAANTNLRDLSFLHNEYAYLIIRRSVEPDNERLTDLVDTIMRFTKAHKDDLDKYSTKEKLYSLINNYKHKE